MAKSQATTQRIASLLKHWPSDPVRPASVSVQTYLQSFLPASHPLKGQQQPAQPATTTSTTTTTTAAPPRTISASSLNALSSLLEDRYLKRYPMPQQLRRPASNPDHYDNVIREFAEAPNRDWWGRVKKRLWGLFRLQ